MAPLWQRIVNVVVGTNTEFHLIRPTGVAASGEVLFVADPGSQALWIFDLAAKRCRRVPNAGRERLISPVALAIGPRGGAYLADSYLAEVVLYDARGRLVRTIHPTDFQRPAGVAYDAARDRLYVADSAAHRVWILAGDGTSVGALGQRGTGPGEFNFPTHVAVDRDGNLYVTDALGFRIQEFTAQGQAVRVFGRHGDASGDFAIPKGIALDSAGHLYVADALFDAVQIFDHADHLLLTIGQRGPKLGEFSLPNGLYIDARDRLYVADSYNHRVQMFEYLEDDSKP